MMDNQKDTQDEPQQPRDGTPGTGDPANGLTLAQPGPATRNRLMVTLAGVATVGAVLGFAYFAAPPAEKKPREIPPPPIRFDEPPRDLLVDFEGSEDGKVAYHATPGEGIDEPSEPPQTQEIAANGGGAKSIEESAADAPTQPAVPIRPTTPEVARHDPPEQDPGPTRTRPVAEEAAAVPSTPVAEEVAAVASTPVAEEVAAMASETAPAPALVTEPEPAALPNIAANEVPRQEVIAEPVPVEPVPEVVASAAVTTTPPAAPERPAPPIEAAAAPAARLEVALVNIEPEIVARTGALARTRHQISNAQMGAYRAITAGRPQPAAADQSPSRTTYREAQAFAAWLTARERAVGELASTQEFRLPTAIEVRDTAVWRQDDDAAASSPDARRPFGLVLAKVGTRTLAVAMKDTDPAVARRGLLKQSRYLITAGQFDVFRAASAAASAPGGTGSEPAKVSLAEARAFVRWLNKTHAAAGKLAPGTRYDLPDLGEVRSAQVWRDGDVPQPAPRAFGIVLRK